MKLIKRILIICLAIVMLCSSVSYANDEVAGTSTETIAASVADNVETPVGESSVDAGTDDVQAGQESSAQEADILVSESSGEDEESQITVVIVEQQPQEESESDAATVEDENQEDATEADEGESTAADETPQDEEPVVEDAEKSALTDSTLPVEASEDDSDAKVKADAEESVESNADETDVDAEEQTENIVVIEEQEGLKAGAASQPISSVLGTQSNKTIQILSKAVDTTAQSGHQSISFTFNCAEDNTVYEAYITGIKYFNGTVDADNLSKLAADIADSFYAGNKFIVSDSQDFHDNYGFSVAPIDAEKRDEQDTGHTKTLTDEYLCWAGSAADMMSYTGWAGSTEDVVLDYFEAAYTDKGSSQDTGIKWYFNGTNGEQTVDQNGEIIYNNTETRMSQERLVNNEKLGRRLLDYAAETFTTFYEVKDTGISYLYDAAMRLKDGVATGLGIYFYDDNGTQNGGHAITLFGYVKDAVKTGINALKALFIADPDNNKFEKPNRSDIVDSVTMYTLSSWIGKDGNTAVTTYELKGYTSDHSPILDYTVLEPYSSEAEELKETSGTKDAINTIDYTPVFIEVDNNQSQMITSAEVTDNVQLWAAIKNVSYKKLDGSLNPYLVGSFKLYLENQLIDTVPVSCSLNGKGLKPNESAYFYSDYKVKNVGSYKVEFILEAIYYDDENNGGKQTIIPEAYYNNNVGKFCHNFTVKPTIRYIDEHHYTADRYDPLVFDSIECDSFVFDEWEDFAEYLYDEEGNLVNYSEEEMKNISREEMKSIPGYSNNEIFKTIEGIGIRIGKVRGEIETLVNEGQVINSKAYTVDTDSEGNTVIKFRSFYLNQLLPGTHHIHVLDKKGNTIAMLALTVR